MKMFRRIILSLTLIVGVCFLLVSCDTVKQIISDVAAPEIESQINDMLGLADAPTEEQFALPEATRYENFKIEKSDDGKTTTYAGDVFEPKVEFADYAEELSEKLGADFSREEIESAYEDIKEMQQWTYEDENGSVYTFNFKELVSKDGTVERWNIAVIVYDPSGSAE